MFHVVKHEGFGKDGNRGSNDMVNDPQGLRRARRIPSFPQLLDRQHQLRGNGRGGAFVFTLGKGLYLLLSMVKKL